jgi:3-methyladenine DNA glycosylase AlkD
MSDKRRNAAEIAAFVQRELAKRADPAKAAAMAAYMKTNMPFYGVQKPGRTEIAGTLESRFDIRTLRQTEQVVTRLWRLPHRKEKYLAVQVAQRYPACVATPSLPLHAKLIGEGAKALRRLGYQI